jgi:bifunctional aspartokinase / homoserine dehydrogenase 1
MQVLKFGGTSVANAENIQKVASIVNQAAMHGKVVVVVSAMSGITDQILQAGKKAAAGDEDYHQCLSEIEHRHLQAVKTLIPITQQSGLLSSVKQHCNELEDFCNGIFLLKEFSPRTRDQIMSYGELMNTLIIGRYFESTGMDAHSQDAREWIQTNDQFGKAGVDFSVTNLKINKHFEETNRQITVVPGFVSRTASGITTTLGRGGSDYTAAIIGAALEVDSVEIWTDVSGMMTADPRLVQQPRIIPQISYQEAMELSHFGAKVIYPPTIQPLRKKNIACWIKNTFAPQDPGTVITDHIEVEKGSVRGISSMNHIALLSLEGSGMVGVPGFSKRLFETLAQQEINIILITQSSSEHSICVAIEEQTAQRAVTAVSNSFQHEMEIGKLEPVVLETGLSILALVGDNMKSHPGVAGRMFGVLGRNGVNIRAIAQGSSERNISAVIATTDVKKALNVLHESFFEKALKQINLFLIGVGNVGSKLLSQLDQQSKYLEDKLQLQINLVGLANSRKMVFREAGIHLSNWRETLENGQPMHLDTFVSTIRNQNLRNAVFADVTAHESVASVYQNLLSKSVNVVACNKIAAASSYENYIELKTCAGEHHCQFLFETNVGAGLPIIGTLNDLLRSGDNIRRMEAVLSGTLNYVFNHYDGTTPFSQVVRQAQEEGYTEPDPRLDLSGTDVMRKIMILARESGAVLEMKSIENQGFLPASCLQGSVEDFYQALEKEEAHFKSLWEQAQVRQQKLKFVASYSKNENDTNGRASVGLQGVGPEHPFYHLYGKDNVVLFYTDRYAEQPLTIKGAGAGAEVTASGVFADIIRTAR